MPMKAIQDILTGPASRFHGQASSPPVGRPAQPASPQRAHGGAVAAAATAAGGSGGAGNATAAAAPHPRPPVGTMGALGPVMAAGRRTAAPAAGADVDAAGAPSYKNARGVPLTGRIQYTLCQEIKRKDRDTSIVGTEAMINRPTVDIDASVR